MRGRLLAAFVTVFAGGIAATGVPKPLSLVDAKSPVGWASRPPGAPEPLFLVDAESPVGWASRPPGAPGPLFLVDADRHPHVDLSWPTRGNATMAIGGERAYLAPNDKTPLGGNIAAYVALGGTRLDYGLVDPRGTAVRVGFYKIDKAKPFFDTLADDALITVTLRGVKFNQPATARPETVLQHLKFEGNTAVLGCAADPNVLATFNTYSKEEDLAGRVNQRNGRLGVLSEDPKASVKFETDKDGAITLTARVPYALFKHADDPWLRSNPGDFTEPIHFHIEFEAVPEGTPARENATKRSPS